jgi:hypothetical protein
MLSAHNEKQPYGNVDSFFQKRVELPPAPFALHTRKKKQGAGLVPTAMGSALR